MKSFASYLLRVISAVLLQALLERICPSKGAGRIARLAGGLMLVMCVLSPLVRLDTQQLSALLARTVLSTQQATTGIEIPTQDLASRIISERVQTYILDKAVQLGLQIEVEVSMHTEGAYPYPDGVRLCGSMDESQRQELRYYIEENFAIPADRQVFEP